MRITSAVCTAVILALQLSAERATAGQASPCATTAHHQFDFWVGNWRVTDASGVFAGTNDVTSEFGGCALEEHWKDADGSRGSSFNTFMPASKQWHQTWVDSHGLTLLLFGTLQGRSMVLAGSRKTHSGLVVDRITWTPLADGRVRQHWQERAASGTQWRDIFDGYYARVN